MINLLQKNDGKRTSKLPAELRTSPDDNTVQLLRCMLSFLVHLIQTCSKSAGSQNTDNFSSDASPFLKQQYNQCTVILHKFTTNLKEKEDRHRLQKYV